jgi:hypothetical protein
MSRTARVVLSLLFTSFLILSAPAQDKKSHVPDETSAQIPVLSNFHDVIFPLWHSAWPEKNIAMIVAALPDVKQFSDSISRVRLPGILRDKEKIWTAAIATLQAIVAGYEKAAAPPDSVKLLDATEQLHSQYEKLIRITRPVLKEIDAFHQVLYALYHHALPEKDEAAIVALTGSLKEKMSMLENVTLPERLQKRDAAFREARAALAASVKTLDASTYHSGPAEFTANVEKMHSHYQDLEKVFE